MTVDRGRYYPEMPPMLPGETDDTYTDRLTGADGKNQRPYDHVRNRQCSIGWHEECSEREISDRTARRCQCPCHDEPPATDDAAAYIAYLRANPLADPDEARAPTAEAIEEVRLLCLDALTGWHRPGLTAVDVAQAVLGIIGTGLDAARAEASEAWRAHVTAASRTVAAEQQRDELHAEVERLRACRDELAKAGTTLRHALADSRGRLDEIQALCVATPVLPLHLGSEPCPCFRCRVGAIVNQAPATSTEKSAHG